MIAPEPDGIAWRKSSYSAESGGCVEVATTPDRALVRDSKNPNRPALAVPAAAWRASLLPPPAER